MQLLALFSWLTQGRCSNELQTWKSISSVLTQEATLEQSVCLSPLWWTGWRCEETPEDSGSSDGGDAVLLLLTATNCPEFIAALTLQGRTCLPWKPEGRGIMIPSDFCVGLDAIPLCLLKVIAFPYVKALPGEQKLWNPGRQTPSPHHHPAELAILTPRKLPRPWCQSLSRTKVGCAVSHLISQSSLQDERFSPSMVGHIILNSEIPSAVEVALSIPLI